MILFTSVEINITTIIFSTIVFTLSDDKILLLCCFKVIIVIVRSSICYFAIGFY